LSFLSTHFVLIQTKVSWKPEHEEMIRKKLPLQSRT